MTFDEIKKLLSDISSQDKIRLLDALRPSFEPRGSVQDTVNLPPGLSPFDFSTLPQLLTRELKRQNITYEEMAMQINVSISTFKRMIANPSAARAGNLHALLKELGMTLWLEK
ncbi:XRE family transcriptional regulator [Rouxiella badensis]|uniref:XRE family transcriptional regulator n=1 Tax=Rouxiella badensis TaxID=1646377 RepID=UPI001D146AAE|nr:XRE family transcriptional regulator [Rouxiella badensis]MCC3721654.1 XRE family transcriptional regulator [Rouxiella badensis]MCC3731298.1 XRE family transcriptional regulator [Rouxiella badensis]MCC3735880.1 XRE family transcriptional regulator [Rouxiella badensis]MCC3742876.1 XRE family transcriptional regulator [Rouxiella badensis]MCC3761175.1 XRE family transcriptional regulator [Rouxiella badensis]